MNHWIGLWQVLETRDLEASCFPGVEERLRCKNYRDTEAFL